IVLWSIPLIFISKDQGLAFKEIVKLIGVFMSMLITVEIIKFKPLNYIKWMLFCYVIAYYIICVFLFQKIGFDVDINAVWMDRSKSGLGLNANTYSYFSYFANLSLFYLIE